MKLDELYRDHVARVAADTQKALEAAARAGQEFDGVVFHAGGELLVHRDDQPYLFRPDFHFARWVPLAGDDHLIAFTPGETPKLIRVVPRDYWYEAPLPPAVELDGLFDVHVVEDVDAAVEFLGDHGRHAFVGADDDVLEALGMEIDAAEPDALMAHLDWSRGAKTAYEVACIRAASERAAKGHAAVREGVAARRSERDLHFDYLRAAALVENEVPYPAIIGWDANAAVLHYTRKDMAAPDPGGVLLIDAGATVNGYASDITRTYATDAAPSLFVELLDGMDALQRELVEAVGPGVPYVELHQRAVQGVAALLAETGILKIGVDEAVERGWGSIFLPHGLGHHLGLQVHDVGGRQAGPDGGTVDPPEQFPHLRTTRDLAAGHVVTIEPGLYFVPMLLDPRRDGADADAVDWSKVDTLIPYGGIRIEDDVLVTAEGREDLSRPACPGHQST